MCKFRDDRVGNVCRTDKLITFLGKKLKSKSFRRDKHIIMNDMRRMGNLLAKFQSVCSISTMSDEDLIKRENFRNLEIAIEELTKKVDDQVKAGLKLSVGYLLKKSAKVIKASYIIEDQLSEADEVGRFLSVLDLDWDFMFRRSLSIVEGQREAVLKKPQSMPIEYDISKLKDYTIGSMDKIVNDVYLKWDAHVFNRMRSLIVCRLTLFNARRGGESSRLTLNEWEYADNEAWVDPQLVENVDDPLEKSMLHTFKLAYQAGKGSNKLVPVLMPTDTIEPIRMLVEDVGISDENPFLFPFTQKSVVGHVSKKLPCPWESNCRTATKYRHRVSTLYALLDVHVLSGKNLSYKHMGHSAEINKKIYISVPTSSEGNYICC